MAKRTITKQEFIAAVKNEINLIACNSEEAVVETELLANGEQADVIKVIKVIGSGVFEISVSVDNLYDRFVDSGGDIRYINKSAESILDAYWQRVGEITDTAVKLQDALDYEVAKGMLMVRLINGRMDPEKITRYPHMSWMDLEATLYLEVGRTEDSLLNIGVPDTMFERWGVSLEEAFEDALTNMREKDPVRLKPINKELRKTMGLSEGSKLPRTMGQSELIVLTNRSGINGATAVLQPGVLEMCAEAVGGDFYILPISIHKVLIGRIIPGVDDKQELKKLIQNINDNHVDPEYVLSDHPYFYSVKMKKIIK